MESIESDGESDVEEVFFLGSHVRPCGPVLGDRLQEIVDAGDHECPNASRRTPPFEHLEPRPFEHEPGFFSGESRGAGRASRSRQRHEDECGKEFCTPHDS